MKNVLTRVSITNVYLTFWRVSIAQSFWWLITSVITASMTSYLKLCPFSANFILDKRKLPTRYLTRIPSISVIYNFFLHFDPPTTWLSKSVHVGPLSKRFGLQSDIASWKWKSLFFERAYIAILSPSIKMKSGRTLLSLVTIRFVILIVGISKPFYFDWFGLPSGAACLKMMPISCITLLA